GASACAAIFTLPRCMSAFIRSPRFSRAFPPKATTTRMVSISQRCDQQRFNGVKTVLGLFECDIHFGFEHFVRYLDAISDSVRLGDLLADGRLGVMESGQAVHEAHMRVSARLHEGHVHLIRSKEFYPFLPDFFRFTHGYPDISVNKIHSLYRCFG